MHISYITESDYNIFCRKSAKATFFHSTKWYQIIKVSSNTKTLYLGFFNGDNMVGAMPVMKRKIFGLKIYGSPLPKSNTPDIFPLYSKSEPSEVLESIDEWVKKNGWKHLQVAWPFVTVGELQHVKDEPRSIVGIDLNHPLNDIWQNLKRETRNRIRQAVHNKIRIHTYPTDRYLTEYRDLLHHTYQISQGISPSISPLFLNEIWERREELPLKIFTATADGKVIAMLWIFFNKNVCHYWEGASDDKGRKFSASHLLHWEVIRWAKKRNIKHYDMVGGGPGRGDQDNSKERGILQFKRSLGAHVSESKVLYWQPKWVQILFCVYRAYLTHIKDRSKK